MDVNPPRTDMSGEVLVLHAESGSSHRLVLTQDVSVGFLAQQLAGLVPPAEQILLLSQQDGLKLEDERSLGEYGLPALDARERPVFLFNRRSLSRSAPAPEKLPVAPLELNVPKELVHHPRSGVEAASPLVRALLDYERHFCLHLLQARAISETGEQRLVTSRRLLEELVVQGAAERAAVANLRGFAAQLSQRYGEFQARYAELVPQQAELVRTFEGDVQALRDVVLDPAVCALEGWSHHATLLDSCGEERLRSWLHDCQHNTDHLMSKAAQVRPTNATHLCFPACVPDGPNQGKNACVGQPRSLCVRMLRVRVPRVARVAVCDALERLAGRRPGRRGRAHQRRAA